MKNGKIMGEEMKKSMKKLNLDKKIQDAINQLIDKCVNVIDKIPVKDDCETVANFNECMSN